MKTTKKILTLVLALALIFALAAPAFAITPDSLPVNEEDQFYVQGSSTSYEVAGQFTVYLYVYSGIYETLSTTYGPINKVYSVTMGSTNSPAHAYTVYDVLTEAESQYLNLDFDIMTNLNPPDPFAHHYDSYLKGAKDSLVASMYFNAMPLYYTTNTYPCGWMFRINSNLPFFYHYDVNEQEWLTNGCLISDAYVSPGDVINLYYCNIYNRSFATKARTFAFVSSSYDNLEEEYTVTLQALQGECYMGFNDSDWTLLEWAPLANKTLDVFVDGTATTFSTDVDGYGTIILDADGTHTIQFDTTTKAFKVNSDSSYPKYKVPKELGLYCRFSF